MYVVVLNVCACGGACVNVCFFVCAWLTTISCVFLSRAFFPHSHSLSFLLHLRYIHQQLANSLGVVVGDVIYLQVRLLTILLGRVFFCYCNLPVYINVNMSVTRYFFFRLSTSPRFLFFN